VQGKHIDGERCATGGRPAPRLTRQITSSFPAVSVASDALQVCRHRGLARRHEYRWVEGRFERSPAIIAEFVRLKVDIIVTHATPNVVAAKQVTSVIAVAPRTP